MHIALFSCILALGTSNLLHPLGIEKPTNAWESSPGTSIPNSAGLIRSTEEQLQFLPPINLPPGVLKTRAIPTNVWWGNLIARDEHAKSHPIYAHPYKIEMELDQQPYGFHLCYTRQYREFGPINANGAAKYYIHGLGIQDFILSAVEFDIAPTVEVMDWDASGFGVTTVMSRGIGHLSAFLVLGMPFFTGAYDSLIPSLSTQHAILSINDLPISNTPVTGHKFVIAMNSGQTWVLYASEPITFEATTQKLVATALYNGILRTALLPPQANASLYDPYVDCIATSGLLVMPTSSEYGIEWQTEGTCENGLLHFAFEHHMDVLDHTSGAFVEDLVLETTTRGKVRGFVSPQAIWKLTEENDVDIGFYPPRQAAATTLAQYQVLELLQADIAAEWQLPRDGSYYFTGKFALKYAQLCLMAADTTVNQDPTLLRTCVEKLQDAFTTSFLQNDWAYPLVYDEIFRGLVSSEAFVRNDKWSDFGNTLYNDHHYHWGYWIVASAILRHLDPTWSKLSELDAIVHLMIRDTANPSEEDPWFPTFRHFDWFAGHSYSHGVSPFADGKDQESTSEEMNFHYGLMLWGKTTGNRALEDLGQLMLKVNKRSIQTYFQMTDDSVVHPAEFIPNKVTGIFFDNKVDYATWFCALPECIHGIQMIPASPMNEYFRSDQFVQEEWDQVLSQIPLITDPVFATPWESLLYTNVAQVNKTMAMDQLRLAPLDNGLSRSWAMYFAATRPGTDIVEGSPRKCVEVEAIEVEHTSTVENSQGKESYNVRLSDEDNLAVGNRNGWMLFMAIQIVRIIM